MGLTLEEAGTEAEADVLEALLPVEEEGPVEMADEAPVLDVSLPELPVTELEAQYTP